MRSDTVRRLAAFAICATWPVGVWAPASVTEQSLRLDPETTSIRFALGAVLHTVHGTARLEYGAVRFDAATGAAAGRVVVDARSLETGHPSRDKKMHRKVLESDSYPKIVLDIHGFTGHLADSGTSAVVLEATIHLHGTEHAVEVPVSVQLGDAVEEAVDSAMAPARRGRSARLSTSFVIPYVEWGLRNPSTVFLRVRKQVEISIEATAVVLP